MRTVTFLHSGNSGDIVYSIPAVRSVLQREGPDCRGQYLIQANVPARYYHPHPLGHVQIDETFVSWMVPLLERQPWCAGAGLYTGQPINHNLDTFRATGFDYTKGHIARYYALAFSCCPDVCSPWLEVDPSPQFKGCILVNRTARYRLDRLDYSFLSGRPDVTFIGLGDELASSGLAGVPCATAKDFLELASWIAGARLFIGNQSLCYALAEALKVPRLLEICDYAPNVIPCGGKAWELWTQPLFRENFQQALEATATG